MENEFLQLIIYNLTGGVRVSKIDFIRAVPESVGLSSGNICEFVNRLNSAELPLHSLLVIKDDRLVFEGYQKPYGPDGLHRMFSVTKSMVSLAIGCLADEGKISLDDHIIDYFPEKLPENVHDGADNKEHAHNEGCTQ